MLTFISCAKTMMEKTPMVLPTASSPLFIEEARHIALSMTAYTAGELADMLHVNPQIAARTCLQFRTFHDEGATGLPALSAYTGMVFRHIAPQDFTAEDWAYAQSHLFITSFLYGLLRPADRIRNYRLEGHVRLPEKEDRTLFAYWRARLTDVFISAIRQQGGILVNLASAEMKNLFDWTRVTREVRVITPDFYTYKGGRLSTVVVYAKMCRGEMTRFILKNRIENPEDLKTFEWEGYRFNPRESHDDHWVFTPGT